MPSPVMYSQITYKLPAEVRKTDPKEHRSERAVKTLVLLNVISCWLRVMFIMVFIIYKKEIMLNVLCTNYSILLLPWFIIFTARWLSPT